MSRKDIKKSPQEVKEYLDDKVGEDNAVALVVLTAIVAAAIAAKVADNKKKKGK